MSKEICDKCKEVDEDRRTLWMACFYEMEELGVPFRQILIGGSEFYTLRVCKRCRSDWMMAIKNWFESPIIEDTCDSGIYIREYGKLMQVTPEQFEERRIRKETKTS